MEIMDGFSRFDKIRNTVYDCNYELDRKKCFYHEDFASDAYKEFLYARRKNTTIADVAMRENLKKHPLKYPAFYSENLEKLRKLPSVRSAENDNKKFLAERYPNTLKTRRMLIKNDRILLSEQVLPKAKGAEKVLLKLKSFFK